VGQVTQEDNFPTAFHKDTTFMAGGWVADFRMFWCSSIRYF